MPPLADCQDALSGFLKAPPGTPVDPHLAERLNVPDGKLAPRLAVYRNNYCTRLIDALAATFPAIVRLVGDDFFRFAARTFIAGHTPTGPTLLTYGRPFPRFLSEFEPARSVPYLADVAELEWLCLESYHARDAEPLEPDTARDRLLSAEAAARLRLHPSLRLLASPHPVSRIWMLNIEDTPITKPVRIESGGEHVVVMRPAATVHVRRVRPSTWHALAALAGTGPDEATIDVGAEGPAGHVEELTALADAGAFVAPPARSDR